MKTSAHIRRNKCTHTRVNQIAYKFIFIQSELFPINVYISIFPNTQVGMALERVWVWYTSSFRSQLQFMKYNSKKKKKRKKKVTHSIEKLNHALYH